MPSFEIGKNSSWVNDRAVLTVAVTYLSSLFLLISLWWKADVGVIVLGATLFIVLLSSTKLLHVLSF
jgi:hypothetical protein